MTDQTDDQKTIEQLFLAELEKDGAAAVAGRVARLEQQLANAQQQLAQADEVVALAGTQAAADHDRIEALEKQVAELAAERDTAVAGKKTAEAAAKKAQLIARPKSTKARKVGPMDPLTREDRVALLARANDMEPFTIVFSNGTHEIRTLNPVQVTGPAWELGPLGLMLTKAPELEGEPGDGRDIRIEGFGLLDADGNQLAWRSLAQPIVLPKQTRMKLDRTVYF